MQVYKADVQAYSKFIGLHIYLNDNDEFLIILNVV